MLPVRARGVKVCAHGGVDAVKRSAQRKAARWLTATELLGSYELTGVAGSGIAKKSTHDRTTCAKGDEHLPGGSRVADGLWLLQLGAAGV